MQNYEMRERLKVSRDNDPLPSASLCLRDYGRQGVGEILEEGVLQVHLESEDPVEELGHVVVVLVQDDLAGVVLALGDQADSHQAVGDV